jgi:hypothetical protein
MEASAAGWRLAVASSGAPESVAAVIRAAMGPALAAEFVLVAGDSVPQKKPSPLVFTRAAAAMRVHPCNCVAVEDSRNGLMAAIAAGMPCVVTPTQLTFHHDFSEAALVVNELGEPGGPPRVVLGGRAWIGRGSHVDLADCEAVLRATQPTGTTTRVRDRVFVA